ncbi:MULTISPECIES: hypothetical protein [unclassified Mesorhizobium]|uniref:hypothetical protein n=1 Tax=unclassified Mesorhizobium TaxID=325217 RepID=UPI00192582B1|nr:MULTISPECIES: hypothetical protein [unclassified Mesorhizobium]
MMILVAVKRTSTDWPDALFEVEMIRQKIGEAGPVVNGKAGGAARSDAIGSNL